MTYLALAVSVALFVWSLKKSGAIEVAYTAVGTARQGMGKLLEPGLSDEDKERAARQASIVLFGHSASIILRFAAAFAVPVIFLFVLILTGVLARAPLFATLESWPFLIASFLAICVAIFWRPLLSLIRS